MWRTAEKRFLWHLCLRNPSLLWNLSLHFLPEAWSPWERQHASSARWACWACIMLAKDRVVVSILWITGYSLWFGCLIDATAASQWRIVENQLLASVGWKWGCQPFSCPCSLNVTHCWKEVSVTSLSKESRPFVKSKPAPEGWALSSSTLRQLWIMVASCLRKIELWCPSFGLSDIHCDLGCLIDPTAASQWRIVEI